MNVCKRTLITPVVILLMILEVGFADEKSDDQQQSRDYFFSPDPGVELIQLKTYNKYAQTHIVYTLFADGRFLYQELTAGNEEVVISLERVVPFEEVDGLVSTIVHSGLIESQFDDFSKRCPYKSTSGGAMHFSLTLQSYRGPGQKEAAPLVKTGRFQLVLLKTAEALPVSEDILALAKIVRRFRAMKKEAEADND